MLEETATVLSYQVGPDGQVYNLKTAQGLPYQIRPYQTADRKPQRVHSGSTKWDWLKKAILEQPRNVTIIYGKFPDYKEMKLAYNAVKKFPKDRIFAARMGQDKLEMSTDKANLSLWIHVAAPVVE